MTDLTAVLGTGAGAALCGSAAVLAYAVRFPSATLLAPSVCWGDRTRPAIALTFDDGPSESTPELLEILARHGAPATFFQCGVNVRRLPQVAREVADAGHLLANHSDTHPKLHFKSKDFIHRELAAAQEAIQRITGAAPRYFRAPFGIRWFGLRQVQTDLGLSGVMWSTMGMDWAWPAGRVADRLLRGAGNGAIFCLHDGRETASRPDIGSTLQAVREVLPKLVDSGFHFERVTEILCPTKN